MTKLERDFQASLIGKLDDLFPGCFVFKMDTSYQQGIPDLLILYKDYWAALECKKGARSRRQPNQPWYIQTLNQMSFAAFISPDNEEDVLYALQQSFGTRR